jgi:hypothetical protein
LWISVAVYPRAHDGHVVYARDATASGDGTQLLIGEVAWMRVQRGGV